MIRYFIRNGIAVSVLSMALLLFGVLALFSLPIQLTPDVSAPVISVVTYYPGATPEDIEQDILIDQEQYLKSLPGLEKMVSTASMGQAEVELEFGLETNQQENIVRINNALAQVPGYPENVDEPTIQSSRASEQPVAWISVRTRSDHSESLDVQEMFDYVEDHVKPYFERLTGISSVRGVYGGTERQMQVMIDPTKLADRGIPISKVRSAIRARNRDVSGGDLDEGKRRFNVRTVGRYESSTDIEDTIIDIQDGTPVYLRDVGYARLGHAEKRTLIRQNTEPALAFGPQRKRGTNLLVVMEQVQQAIRDMNDGPLREKGIYLTQVTDSTSYVRDAVDMVRFNLLFGGLLALGILLIFLRHARSTLIVGLAIPLCVIGAFFVISVSGRSINVISLAGLAFSIGAVLDASIVVLENIYRHRSMGKSSFDAAYDGTSEVWTAILSSVLTNVVVFTPIITLADEAGQIFRDLAIAIVAANILALIVSILIIPPLAARLLTSVPTMDKQGFTGQLQRLFGVASFAARIHDGFLRSALTWLMGGVIRRIIVTASVLAFAVACIVVFMPKTEYLPEGNRQTIIGVLIPPQGYGMPEITAIGQELEKRVKPMLDASVADFEEGRVEAPPLKYFFFAAFRNRMFLFTRPKSRAHLSAVPPALQRLMSDVPGTIAFAIKMSIFSRDIMGSRAINVDIIGPDVKVLTNIAQGTFFKVLQALPGARPEPKPGIEIGQPQVIVRPDWERAAQLGIDVQDIGYSAWVLGDGAYVDDYYHEGDKMDLYLYSTMGAYDTLGNFENIRIATRLGDTVPLSDVASIDFTYGLERIRRVDNQRAVTLRITPPSNISLEEAIEIVQNDIIGAVQADGMVPPGYTMRISGTSDKLSAIRAKLGTDFLLALMLTYLTMVLVFRHWGYPLTVMLSVPIGLTGGVLGLWVLNRYLDIVSPGTIQSLDVLTMLGFVILLGSVINNPILIVQQAINFMRQGLEPHQAIVESTLTRIRPILMTTGTTIFGLMPLVMNPGAGSELYRGLGMVMFGGLILGTVTTIVFIPSVMSLMFDFVGLLRRQSSLAAAAATPAPLASEAGSD
jgi:multidrug efflux pump subunit AcrB